MDKIGFIGIGRMGRWMAKHLLSAGYSVTVYDKNYEAMKLLKEDGAILANSVTELGAKNRIVILMLPNSDAVESVVTTDGLFSSMSKKSIVIDMSSSYVFSTRRLEQKAKSNGIILMDAPVSGGVNGAKKGNLTIMVGGDKENYELLLPIFKCMGKTIRLVGRTGSGHALKAINNYLSATSLYATTEAMMIAKKLGLDLSVALETINESSGKSYSTEYKFPTFVLPRSFASGFSLELLLKDVKMVTSIAQDINVPILLAAVVEQIYQSAYTLRGKDQDHTEIVKFLERMAQELIED